MNKYVCPECKTESVFHSAVKELEAKCVSEKCKGKVTKHTPKDGKVSGFNPSIMLKPTSAAPNHIPQILGEPKKETKLDAPASGVKAPVVSK